MRKNTTLHPIVHKVTTLHPIVRKATTFHPVLHKATTLHPTVHKDTTLHLIVHKDTTLHPTVHRDTTLHPTVRNLLVDWCFEPSQPLGIISGLKETFIKRYVAERTSTAEIRPEEQSEKAESCREN